MADLGVADLGVADLGVAEVEVAAQEVRVLVPVEGGAARGVDCKWEPHRDSFADMRRRVPGSVAQ